MWIIPFPDALAVGILVAYNEVVKLPGASAELMTNTEKYINAEDIAARLIEEVKNLRSDTETGGRVHSASIGCHIFAKMSHNT